LTPVFFFVVQGAVITQMLLYRDMLTFFNRNKTAVYR